MSGKLIGIIIAAVIVVGGGVAYVVTQNKDDEKASTTSNTATASKDGEKDDTVKASLLTVADAGKARKCTFTSSVEDVTSDGTLYTDGKGRGLMQIDVADVGSTNVLAVSDKVYGWTSTQGQTTGFVLNKSELQKVADDAARTQSQTATSNVDQSFDMKCVGWSVNESQLAVPRNIEFLNLPAGQ